MNPWQRKLHQLPLPVLAQAASAFAADPGSLQHLRTGANAVWRVRRQGQDCVLRINHQTLRGRARFALAVAWQAWLARPSGGAADLVATPLRDAVGRLVVQLPGGWLASLSRWQPGRMVGRRCRDPELFRAWAAAVARMHLAGLGFPALPGAPWYHWQQEGDGISQGLKRLADPALVAAWVQVRRGLQQLPREQCCLTHGDQNAGNVIIIASAADTGAGGTRLALIDFDEPMWNWPLSDLVRPLLEQLELLHRDPGLFQHLQEALFAGYASAGGALPADAAAQAGLLLRFKALNGLLSRLQGEDSQSSPVFGGDRAGAVALLRQLVLADPAASQQL